MPPRRSFALGSTCTFRYCEAAASAALLLRIFGDKIAEKPPGRWGLSPYDQSLTGRQFENLIPPPAHEVILGFLLLVEHLPPIVVKDDDPARQHTIEQPFEHGDLRAW